jgi:hypothetical protein
MISGICARIAGRKLLDNARDSLHEAEVAGRNGTRRHAGYSPRVNPDFQAVERVP